MTEDKKETGETLPEKCRECWWRSRCMLTEMMRKKCGGPFKDQKAHMAFIEKEVAEQKKSSS